MKAADAIDPAFAREHPLRAADPDQAEAMVAEVMAARAAGDSVGGALELVITGAPAGLGDPVFGKLDARLGGAMFSIGAVKGVEIGDGFAVAARRGSANNDQMDADGFLSATTAGASWGHQQRHALVLRLAIKPTPSISQTQRTQNLAGEAVEISIHGPPRPLPLRAHRAGGRGHGRPGAGRRLAHAKGPGKERDMKILLLNGPNLNMLGRRESEHYGSLTLDEINRRMGELAQVLGLELGLAQSNHEGELVDILQGAAPEYDGVVAQRRGLHPYQRSHSRCGALLRGAGGGGASKPTRPHGKSFGTSRTSPEPARDRWPVSVGAPTPWPCIGSPCCKAMNNRALGGAAFFLPLTSLARGRLPWHNPTRSKEDRQGT